MVEQWQKIIDFFSLLKSWLLEQCRSWTSDLQYMFKMKQPKCYYRGALRLKTYLGSLRSTFRTHIQLFHIDTGKVQYALDNLQSWVHHTNHDMQTTTMINPITWGQELQPMDSPCLHNVDYFVGEIKKIYDHKNQRLNADTKSYYGFHRAIAMPTGT